MTIILDSQYETRLRERAAREGQEVNALVNTLIAEALHDQEPEPDPDDLTEEQILQIRAGIRRGLTAAAEGRERPVTAYAADVQARRAARRAGSVAHV